MPRNREREKRAIARRDGPACFYCGRVRRNPLVMSIEHLDAKAHGDNAEVGAAAIANRAMLREAMTAAGFSPYAEEWWHFTLDAEPFPDEIFDFPVR